MRPQPFAVAAGVLVCLEAVALLALAGWQISALIGGDADSLTSSIALLVLIVLGDQLGKSVGDMYAGAIGPSILQVLLFILFIAGVSIFAPHKVPPLPDEALTDDIVTISAGLAAYQPGHPYLSPQALMQAADEALYLAKHMGRHRLCLAS